jgi:hypothetical protein
MIDFLRLILRSPDGEGSGDVGDNGDGGSDDVAGDNGGSGETSWLSSFENVKVEHEVYNPDTKTKSVATITPKEDPNFNKYKTADEFYKGYRNLIETVGKKGVIVPDDKSKPEDVEKFYNAIGRPEKPEGYKISPIENVHPSIEITPESIAGYQMLAHKYGLTQKQADGLNRDYLSVMSKAAEENERLEKEAVANAQEKLQKEWGSKFEAKRDAIANAIINAGGQEALDAMGGVNGYGNNPVVLRALGNLVAMIGEDSMNTFRAEHGSGVNNASGNETPDQAMEKIRIIESDPNGAFLDDKHPAHKDAIIERNRLYKIAFPGQEN